MEPGSEEALKSCLSLIDNEVREYRSKGKYGNMFPQRWIPATLGILEEGFSLENKLMNPTFKIIRPKVEEHYKELFEFLYSPESKSVVNPRNLEAIGKLLGEQ